MGTDTTLGAVAPSPNGKRPRLSRQFVEAAEYCALAISNRTLVRLDDARNSLRGLHDPATGVTYVIHEDKLFSEIN